MPTIRTPEEFAEHLLEFDKADSARHRDWLRSSNLASATVCPFCSADISPGSGKLSYLTFLIPPSLGGDSSTDNQVRGCASCVKRKNMQDPLGSGVPQPLSPSLMETRSNALLNSRNHLTNLWPGIPLPRLKARLSERFAHPRFRAFASTTDGSRCFVGWLLKHGRPEAYSNGAGILRMGFGATLHDLDNALVFELDPSRFYDAIWTLIELNALVVPLGEQVVLDEDDWRRCWVDSYASLADNRRRHARGQTRRPWPPKELSNNPATVRSRNRKANKERQQKQREKELKMSRALQVAWTNYTNPNHRMFAIAPPKEELDAMYQEHCLLLMDKKTRRKFLQRQLKGS